MPAETTANSVKAPEWTYHADAAVRAPVAALNGAVVVGTASGTVTALGADTGTVDSTVTVPGAVTSVTAAGESVSVGTWGGDVYALNASR